MDEDVKRDWEKPMDDCWRSKGDLEMEVAELSTWPARRGNEIWVQWW